MATTLMTFEDFQNLKKELLEEIRAVLKETPTERGKPWLKSKEVCELLMISKGTLQTLRSNGTLPSTKIGGVIYYDMRDIKKMMESKK